jgi:hypothetical protein
MANNKKKDLKTMARRAARHLVIAADEALIDAGRKAKARRRKRAAKRTLKVIGKAALVAGVVTAATIAARRGSKPAG